MTEYNKMYITHFYYNYLLVLTVISSVLFWFQGDVGSVVFALLLLGLPLLFLLHTERQKEEKLPTSHFEFAGIAGILATPGSFVYVKHPNVYLCAFFYLLALVFGFLNKYLQGRYYVLHCNPSVSQETKASAGRMQWRPLLRMFISGSVFMLFLLVLFVAIPEPHYRKQETTNEKQQEQDNVVEQSTNKKADEVQKKMQEENEKAADNFWLQLLRYVVTIAIIVLVVLAIAYAVFRLVLYLIYRRGKVEYEFEEQLEEKTQFQEITRLMPTVKKAREFPHNLDGRIRKIFYQTVEAGAAKNHVNDSLTPKELQKEYMKNGEKEQLLTKLYEKARYAKESVTEDEWKKVKGM